MNFSEAVLSGVNNFMVSIFDIDPQGKPRRRDPTIVSDLDCENVSNDTTRCKIRLACYN